MLVYVCTSNAGKLRELTAAAEAYGNPTIELEPLPGIGGITPPEETGKTFEENAVLKAVYYSGLTTETVLCDDSGLAVEALYGAPGIYSARYAGPDASDEDNNNLLLRTLGPTAVRTARFVCVVAVAQAGQVKRTAQGTTEGEILAQPRGTNGFGYDPLFLYPPLQRSFAEMSDHEKLGVSHRGRAMGNLLREWLIRPSGEQSQVFR